MPLSWDKDVHLSGSGTSVVFTVLLERRGGLLFGMCDAFLVIGSCDGSGEEMHRGHEPFSLPFANSLSH